MPARMQFRVDTIPVAQPRHKFNGRTGRTYLDNKHPVHTFKACVQIAARNAGAKVFQGPVSLTLHCYFPRLTSHYRKNGDIRPSAPKYKSTKPDFDNVAKATCDALNKIAWNDDSQVVEAKVVKYYCDDANPVGVVIELSEIE